jgi:quinoprotein glucose dehydrogenase
MTWKQPLTAVALASTIIAAPLSINARSTRSDTPWPVYGGNSAGQRHSPLAQITRANVSSLREAWRIETGPGGLQTSPIAVGGVIYAATPDQSAIAIDGATGKELWRYSSGTPSMQPARGLSYWTDGIEKRLFVTASQSLVALDPATGKPIPGFGDGGKIDLRSGMGRDPESFGLFLTSPGIIHKDLIITGYRTGEGLPGAPGQIRAFDVRSGKLAWTFHTIPHEGEPGSETWPKGAAKDGGGANAWAGMALDEARGIVYAPTGSAVPDFDGTGRLGDNLYANSLLALDAQTGKILWHFQAVHHDLWDRDFPSPPTLLTVTKGGKRIDAVAQTSKQGFVFVFDRVTGKPLFPIEERPVPQTNVPGEKTAPTQPHPTLPAPFARQRFTEDMLTKRTPEAHAAALAKFKTLSSDGPFAPFSLDRKTIVFPGYDGGAEWGGSAVDPARGVLYVNANDVPWIGGLRVSQPTANSSRAVEVYAENCAACHGMDRKGASADFPSLVNLGSRMSRDAASAVISGGKGRMPGFPQISSTERGQLLDMLYNEFHAQILNMPPEALREGRLLGGSAPTRYQFTGYEKFQDAQGYPAVLPPWGTLNAIDLNNGKTLWRIPLGEYPELVAKGMSNTGSENYGGPVLTKSGLIFIGATIFDRKFRAFDARKGTLLWETQLPYAGNATPIVYAIKGRQYVLIAASGGKDRNGPQGSAYVAYALPQDRR